MSSSLPLSLSPRYLLCHFLLHLSQPLLLLLSNTLSLSAKRIKQKSQTNCPSKAFQNLHLPDSAQFEEETGVNV